MHDVVRAIESSVRELLARRSRLVVAVSGGADSAVLLDAIARLRGPEHLIVIAVVDHGTGPHATEAAAQSVAKAALLGLSAISERLALMRRDEASLRRGRWAFLRRVAQSHSASVVTGHSWDDQVETVVMRILRGSSARGLAGLLAPSPVERPLLLHRREDVRHYAGIRDIAFTDDPTNVSLDYLRNRVRLQLLPAIRRVAPTFEQEIWDLSRRAAELRIQVDAVAAEFLCAPPRTDYVALDAAALSQLPDDSLRLLLPALTARAGITLDRRGLVRLAAVVRSSSGTSGQLSGGLDAVRTADRVLVSPGRAAIPDVLRLRPAGETIFGQFRFRAVPATSIQVPMRNGDDPWRISVPKSAQVVVRQWNPGDRLTIDLKGSRRRVKRFFADARLPAPLRRGWPVVLCDDDVVWIPGIRASQHAIKTEGRMVHFRCERLHD